MSQRGSEATRSADYEADAASDEMRDVVGSLPLCRYSIPAAACGPQQLLAKRARGSLRERQQSLQYTFSRERERERERVGEHESESFKSFCLLSPFYLTFFLSIFV